MSDPYLGEVRFFGFAFAPRGWAQCNGQLLPISNYQALYSILGVAFGGDGRTTFGLPNLQGAVPMHWGQNNAVGLTLPFGAKGGEASHTLTLAETPAHAHVLGAVADTATQKAPENNAWAKFPNLYGNAGPLNTSLANNALASTGSGAAHENRQPYLVGNFCIAISGIFPSHN